MKLQEAPAKPQSCPSLPSIDWLDTRRCATEATISMFPNYPGTKGYQKVQPFLVAEPPELTPTPQALNTTSSDVGAKSWRPTCSKEDQTCPEKTRVISKCCMFSCSWLQRGHLSRCDKPLWASRSAVQHLLWTANHRNNWDFFFRVKLSKSTSNVQRKPILWKRLHKPI